MNAHCYYILIPTSCIPLSLHVFGLLLLWKARTFYRNHSQYLFLVNLSVAELVFVVLGLLMYVTSVFGYEWISFKFTVLQYIGGTLAYFFIMIFITLDRFLEVYLNIKYPLYWGWRGTRNLIVAMWFLSIALSALGLVYPDFDKQQLYRLCYRYMFPLIEFCFILIALLVYGYVFVKLRWNRNRRVIYHPENDGQTSGASQSSRVPTGFFVPTLVILTFVLIAILPDLIYFHAQVVGRKLSDQTECTVYGLYLLAMATDALIYVMLSPPLRNLIRRKISGWRMMAGAAASTNSKDLEWSDTIRTLNMFTELNIAEENETNL